MTETSSNPRRRFLRFSLRAMLLLVLAIAAALGWIMHKAREQGIAVAALKKRGCSIDYIHRGRRIPPTVLERLRMWIGEKEPYDVTGVYCGGMEMNDAGLAHVESLTQIEQLFLGGSKLTDASLVHLQELTQLDFLDLSNIQVTDAGLVHLQGLTQLTGLDLGNTRTTDPGLAHLQGMTQLRILFLDGTQVTDAGLAHLQGLTQLEGLDLGNTRVTDAGLVYLIGLTELKGLGHDGTQVTDAALNRLGELGPSVILSFFGHLRLPDAGANQQQNVMLEIPRLINDPFSP